jgi:acyl dehydratase
VDAALREALVREGERVSRSVRYTREGIALFALATHDTNPLHHDDQRAGRTRFGAIIASGEQTMSMMTGLIASHFSRSADGVAREMLCLNLNFSFRLPVYADQDIAIEWVVQSAQWNGKLAGMLGQLEGTASVGGAPCVVARATILVKHGS